MYLGPSYSNIEVLKQFKKFNLKKIEVNKQSKYIAGLLKSGKVIAIDKNLITIKTSINYMTLDSDKYYNIIEEEITPKEVTKPSYKIIPVYRIVYICKNSFAYYHSNRTG